jgi:hypothetical protein
LVGARSLIIRQPQKQANGRFWKWIEKGKNDNKRSQPPLRRRLFLCFMHPLISKIQNGTNCRQLGGPESSADDVWKKRYARAFLLLLLTFIEIWTRVRLKNSTARLLERLKTPKKVKLKTKTLLQNSKLLKNAFYSKKVANFLIFIKNVPT